MMRSFCLGGIHVYFLCGVVESPSSWAERWTGECPVGAGPDVFAAKLGAFLFLSEGAGEFRYQCKDASIRFNSLSEALLCRCSLVTQLRQSWSYSENIM